MRRLLLALAVLAPLLFVATGVYQIIYTDWLLVCEPIAAVLYGRA